MVADRRAVEQRRPGTAGTGAAAARGSTPPQRLMPRVSRARFLHFDE